MHGSAANADPRPFLTIVSWPDGLAQDDAVALLAGATGHDAADTRMRLGPQPPLVYRMQLESDVARRAAEAVIAAGGDAFTTTFADLAAFGPSLRIRDLRLDEGDIALELWDGMTTTVRRTDVQILVRAHFTDRDDAARIKRQREALSDMRGRLTSRLSRVQYGWAAQMHVGEILEQARAELRQVKTSDKLDIHARDGTIYQIDGDKFGYRALGELRGHSDRVNMDAMCELLAHVSPDEIVDDYFSLWRPPPGFERLRLPGPRPDDPAFAFYSRWAALVYRHVLGS